MALVTISGYPCSGKTFRSSQIKEYLCEKFRDSHEVCVISEHTLQISRAAYDDSRSEKPARGLLFTTIQRELGPRKIVIVDAPNYIKGFRYQIYCSARESKVRMCTVHVLTPPDICRSRNAARSDNERYKSETLENLFQRFEEPSSMVRWDSPLFTLLLEDELPGEQIAEALSSSDIKPPNSGTLSTSKAPTDALLVLEKTTGSIVASIMAQQGYSTGGGTYVIGFGTSQATFTLPNRTVTLSELQRLKRHFVIVHKKAITLGTTEKGDVEWTEESVGDKFMTYLVEHLQE